MGDWEPPHPIELRPIALSHKGRGNGGWVEGEAWGGRREEPSSNQEHE